MANPVPTTITPQQVVNNKENLDDYSEVSMIEGFKKFIDRGQMIDMAVGVVMGGAVTTVVNAIVNSFINPLIAMIFGKPDLNNTFAFTVNGATVSFGAILGALLNFLIIGIAIYFCIVVPINKFRDYTKKHAKDAKKEGKEPEDLNAEDQTVMLLTQIRDQLAAQNGTATPNGTAVPTRTSSTPASSAAQANK